MSNQLPLSKSTPIKLIGQLVNKKDIVGANVLLVVAKF